MEALWPTGKCGKMSYWSNHRFSSRRDKFRWDKFIDTPQWGGYCVLFWFAFRLLSHLIRLRWKSSWAVVMMSCVPWVSLSLPQMCAKANKRERSMSSEMCTTNLTAMDSTGRIYHQHTVSWALFFFKNRLRIQEFIIELQISVTVNGPSFLKKKNEEVAKENGIESHFCFMWEQNVSFSIFSLAENVFGSNDGVVRLNSPVLRNTKPRIYGHRN